VKSLTVTEPKIDKDFNIRVNYRLLSVRDRNTVKSFKIQTPIS
jgi:hypothetical protein